MAEIFEPTINKADNEITSTRVFDVPVDVLYKAFENPEVLATWWGPKGFTNTFDEFNLRAGGQWKFTMHGPNGANYGNLSEFVEVSPQRIILNHISNPKFTMTISFADVNGKSRLTWNMQFNSATEFEAVLPIVPNANEENFDRLEDALKKM